MKIPYTLQFALSLFLTFGTQAGSQEVKDVKHIIQKEIAEEPTSIKSPAIQSNGVHMFVFNNMRYIDFETAESRRNLQIIDISGRSLFSETLPETKQYSKMLPFNPGIYIINLTAKDILVIKKVVIK